MIQLSFPLEAGKQYINGGNIFSKGLVLERYSKKHKTLFVVNEAKKITYYNNIFDYIGVSSIVVKDYAAFVELLYAERGLFVVDQGFFEAEIVSEYHFEKDYILRLSTGESVSLNDKISELSELGYKHSEYGKMGSYKKLGDTLHIYPNFTEQYYFRLSFFDEELETIESVYKDGQIIEREELVLGKIEKLVALVTPSNNPPFIPLIKGETGTKGRRGIIQENSIISLLQKHNIQIVADSLDFYQYKSELQDVFPDTIFLNAIKNMKDSNENLHIHELYIDDLGSLTQYLQDQQYAEIHIFTKNKSTLDNFLRYNNIAHVKVHDCRVKNIGSFYTDVPAGKNMLVIADDNLNRVFVKKRVKRSFSKDLDLLVNIKEGDYITHIDHGVGVFVGIIKRELQINGKKLLKEYLELEYLDNDKLFIPITEVKRVSKFIGNENPKLTNLGTKEWSKKLKKVSEEVEDIAGELLDIFAKRQLKKGFKFQKDTQKIQLFQDGFPYAYTDDQIHAIDEILEDMGSEHPMDRLLNGDVGFGKTEVCFMAIYNAICNKKQAILLTPLVVLAYEHYEKAIQRFADFGIKVGVLTRFEKSSAASTTLAALAAGELDLVVGTHKLLSRDVQFKDLGLVVIDEEHKFGVKDKERIKELKGQIDILSLSATPIPRSLNMALNGLKQVSMLKTPPYGRKPIETYVSRFSDEVIIDACRHEFERGGQVFFIHNRVQNIEAFQNYLQTLFPHKSIIVTHGQLPGDELEKRIIAFRKGDYDILLSTTVIENGVDFPNVNTIFMNEAYKFGISQIHQLRGRVGRAERQGYCYLLYRNENINAEAEKRLKTIVDYSHLGAGFELAMRDLEIRGGGEILGKKQSGQVAEVGISIFIEMLETKIDELKRVREYKAQKELETANPLNSEYLTPTLSSEEREKNALLPPQRRGTEGEPSAYKINTSIDLNISAYIPDDFFGSSMDKMNFYRELESVDNAEDLETIIEGFQGHLTSKPSRNSPHPNPLPWGRGDNNSSSPSKEKGLGNEVEQCFPPETQNLFNLLKLKFKAGEYMISQIKKVGQNYQLDFASESGKELEVLRQFLDRDREVRFTVVDTKRLRSPTKKYTSDLDFMQYMTQIFSGKIVSKKYKLKK